MDEIELEILRSNRTCPFDKNKTTSNFFEVLGGEILTTCDLVGLNLCAWKLGQNISKEYEGELSAMPSPEQVALLCRYMYLCILKIAFTDIFSIITVIKVQ